MFYGNSPPDQIQSAALNYDWTCKSLARNAGQEHQSHFTSFGPSGLVTEGGEWTDMWFRSAVAYLSNH